MKLDSFWEEVDDPVRNPWEEARQIREELKAVQARIVKGQEWFSKHTLKEVGEEMWELAGRTLLEQGPSSLKDVQCPHVQRPRTLDLGLGTLGTFFWRKHQRREREMISCPGFRLCYSLQRCPVGLLSVEGPWGARSSFFRSPLLFEPQGSSSPISSAPCQAFRVRRVGSPPRKGPPYSPQGRKCR